VVPFTVYGDGTGPIDAFVDGLHGRSGFRSTCATTTNTRCAPARTQPPLSYVEVVVDGRTMWGVGIRSEHRHRFAGGDRQRGRARAR